MNMGYDIAGNTKYDFIELDEFRTRKLIQIIKAANKKQRQYEAKLYCLEALISKTKAELKIRDDVDLVDLPFQLFELEMKHGEYLDIILGYYELSQDCQEILAERG